MLKKDIRQRKECPIIFELLGLQSSLREQFLLTGVWEGTVCSGRGSMVTDVTFSAGIGTRGPITLTVHPQGPTSGS